MASVRLLLCPREHPLIASRRSSTSRTASPSSRTRSRLCRLRCVDVLISANVSAHSIISQRATTPEAEKQEAAASVRLLAAPRKQELIASCRSTTSRSVSLPSKTRSRLYHLLCVSLARPNPIPPLIIRPPQRPATPTPSPDSPQHPARLRESFQVLLSSIDSVKAHLNEVSAAAATSNAVRDTEKVAVDIKILSLRDAVKQLITEVGDGKSSTAALEKRFEAIAKDVHNATAAASCVKTLNPFLLECVPSLSSSGRVLMMSLERFPRWWTCAGSFARREQLSL